MFTLTSFKKMANTFKKKWFPSEELAKPNTVENAYWKIVETSDETVQVHYGSDLDVTMHGSGFIMEPTEERHTSGWNLNIFPKLPDSLLSYLDESTAGVSAPMMYIGMLFSTFCWHTEDNYLFSINYLHEGASKTWYGVPGSKAEMFEAVMQKTVPELFKTNPDLLYQLVTMISPRILVDNNVPVYSFLQEAGQFVITFPKAYHAGFSHGFNCAESTNFALEEWLPFGRESTEKYRQRSRSSVLSLDKLLCNAASQPHSQTLNDRLKEELPIMRRDECYLREKVLSKEGTWKCIQFSTYEGKDTTAKECTVCKYDCYLSALVCPCSPNKFVCLRHSENLCECPATRRILLFRYRLMDLDEMLRSVGVPPSETSLSTLFDNSQCKAPISHSGKGHTGQHHPTTPEDKSKTSPKKCTIKSLARNGGIKRMEGITYLDPKEEINEGLFVIESIVDSRTQNDKLEYLLKWEGYPQNEATWEKAEDFACPGLVDQFEEKHKRKAPGPKRSTRTTKGKRVRY
eukprot:TRINITY_DN809_c0_g1_i2.p1 TRINITY_DN809_c0_g1~~TRINITY_DN809_c0_g1_i2.p1  ORF type:complete len:516 (-),score=111.82 TRINITY_DN809_c0_g1_i2:71-1618(-)